MFLNELGVLKDNSMNFSLRQGLVVLGIINDRSKTSEGIGTKTLHLTLIKIIFIINIIHCSNSSEIIFSISILRANKVLRSSLGQHKNK